MEDQKKNEFTTRSKLFVQKTLDLNQKMPWGPTPSLVHRHFTTQPSTTSSMTLPLGVRHWEPTVLELRGLLLGIHGSLEVDLLLRLSVGEN
jgi:hypothetical protein